MTGDTRWTRDAYVRDLTTNTTTRESVSSNGEQANNSTELLSISDAGDVIAFGSWATNLVPSDTNNDFDVFLRNRTTNTTTRITGPSGAGGQTAVVAVSGDGSTVLLDSSAALSPIWSGLGGGALYAYHVVEGSLTAIRGCSYIGGFELTGDGSEAIVATEAIGVAQGKNWIYDYFIMPVP